jgi:hypothetical protein
MKNRSVSPFDCLRKPRWFNLCPKDFRITSSKAVPRDSGATTGRSPASDKENLEPNGLPCRVHLLLPNCATLKFALPRPQQLRQAILNGLKKKKIQVRDRERVVLCLRDGTLEQEVLANCAPCRLEGQLLQFAVKTVTLNDKNIIKNYCFERVIGQGGFSKVLLARSMVDGNYYAVKAISKTFIRAKEYYNVV